MKARHIRKLRKQVQSFKSFRIATCCGAFGDFFFTQDYQFKRIKALNPIHAIKRYMKWHFRHFKYKSRHQHEWYKETSYNWGEILVVDEKGYKRYYH